MELCSLPTLQALLALEVASARSVMAPPVLRWQWVHQLAIAMETMHTAGLIHNDIKPSNIFCSPLTGETKLGDFGCSRRFSELGDSAGGTLLYTAPEVRAGGSPAPSSDVYSLGVCLVEIHG